MKNKILKTSFIMLGTLAISSTCFATTGKVTVDNLRIRSSASTNSEIIEMADINDTIEVKAQENDEWYQVVYNGKTGYASQKYIKVNEPVEGESSNTSSESEENNNASESNTEAENNQATESNNEQANNSESNEKNSEESSNTEINTNNNSSEQGSSEKEQNSNTNNSVTPSKESLQGKSVKLANQAKLRLLPNMMSNVVADITSGIDVIVLYDMNNWVKVEANGEIGWVTRTSLNAQDSSNNESNDANANDETNKPEEKNETNNEQPAEPENTNTENQANDNTTSEEQSAYVNVERANIRESADGNADVKGVLEQFDLVTIVGEEDDFYQIKSDTVNGYIAKRLVTIGRPTSSRSLEFRASMTEEAVQEQAEVANNTESQEETSQSGLGSQVVEFAETLLGSSYVYGGKSPNTGFDCSGFTSYVFGKFGYSLSATSGGQESNGVEVDKSEMKEGDLIIFLDNAKSKVGHVGIYIGDGKFIHAANSNRGVVTDNVDNSYYGPRFVSARRIV